MSYYSNRNFCLPHCICVACLQVEELDLPMKRNQAFIGTHFSKTRDRFCDHILGEGEERKMKRKELLVKVGNKTCNGHTSE